MICWIKWDKNEAMRNTRQSSNHMIRSEKQSIWREMHHQYKLHFLCNSMLCIIPITFEFSNNWKRIRHGGYTILFWFFIKEWYKLFFASEKEINSKLICFIWRSENKPLSLQAHEEIFPISAYAFFSSDNNGRNINWHFWYAWS